MINGLARYVEPKVGVFRVTKVTVNSQQLQTAKRRAPSPTATYSPPHEANLASDDNTHLSEAIREVVFVVADHGVPAVHHESPLGPLSCPEAFRRSETSSRG